MPATRHSASTRYPMRAIRAALGSPRRVILLLLGAAVLLGGPALAFAASHHGHPNAVTVDTPVTLAGDGVSDLLGVFDSVHAADQLPQAAPFGSRDVIANGYAHLFGWMSDAESTIRAAAAKPGETLAQLEKTVDDIDGDGNPASDVHGIPGLTVDLDVAISPKTAATSYVIATKITAQLSQDSPLAFLADKIRVGGQAFTGALTATLNGTVHLDPANADPAHRITLTAPRNSLGTVDLSVSGDYAGNTNPLAFHVGLLDVTGTGSLSGNAGISVAVQDPNGDGVIDRTELADPASLAAVSCRSTGAHADLTVTGSLAGLGTKIGHVTLDDSDLCDGVSAPDVTLGDLDQFRNLTLGDLINGLAQVTQALHGAQVAGDLDLPFLNEPVSKLVSVNQRLVKFFVDNGFTDPANPMADITVDTGPDAAIQSLQQLAPKLATALGLPQNALAMHYANGRILFTLQQTVDPAAATGAVDFGNALTGTGIGGLTGSGQASIDPTYKLDLGFGFDLAPGTPLDQRFFVTNGTAGNAFSLDAPVTADIDLKGTVGVVAAELRDRNTNGPVPLLQRRDPSQPMVAVKLLDPNGDGRTTLAELASATGGNQLPVSATINATVPGTDLSLTADVVGVPIAAGQLTLAWPDVPDGTGDNGLTVTGNAQFADTLLPFAFDTSNPQALITQVLTVTRDTVNQVRTAIGSGDTTTTRPLPLVGKSVADLDPVLAKVSGSLDDLLANANLLTLDGLQHKLDDVLANALGASAGSPVPDLVTISYEPRTATTPAAVVVHLALGACSTDRAADRAGCTVTTAPLDVPFNLSLGSGSRIGGIAGIGSSGAVHVSYDARATLTFGVNLPSVTAGPTPTDPPTVSGAPTLFVQDDTGLDIGLGVAATGTVHAALGPIQVDLGTAGDPAKAALGVRFAMKAAHPTGARMAIDSTALTDFLDSLVPGSGSTVHEPTATLQAACPNVSSVVDACAALPVYAEGTDLGTITLAAPNVLAPSGWTIDSSQVQAALSNQAIQFALLVDGVRTLADQLQQGLHSLPAGTKIPLLGTDVTAGADIIKTFNDNVLAKVQQVSDALSTVATTGQARNKAQTILNQIAILRSGGMVTVAITCRTADTKCTGTEPISQLQSLEVHAPLHVGVDGSTAPFDLGFPGLHLASSGGVHGSAGLNVNLAFGIDRDLGFYLPTAGATPEIALTASAALPNVADQPDLTGQLAFLPISIEDEHAGDDVTLSAGINLTTSRSDGRLPLQDLGAGHLTPNLQANADLDLGLATTKPDAAPSFLPTFRADLKIGAGLTWNGTGSPDTTASISFDNVTVDAGTLVADLIKPIANQIHEYTAALEGPLDAIRRPIPGVAEAARIAGRPAPTWYDAFKAIDDVTRQPGQASGLQLADRLAKFVDLVRNLDSADLPAGQIPIGSFTVLPSVASQPLPPADADELLGSSTLTTDDVISKLQFDDSQTTADFDAATNTGGLSFPAFQHPTQLFQLLLGKDVPLVYFDGGKLSVQRGFQYAFPVGPAKLYIGGSAELDGHFAIGYDTDGLRTALRQLTDDDPNNDGVWDIAAGLLQGIYLDDNNQNGDDVPEIQFDAELTAGASVGVPGLEAGAEGGVHGHIGMDLHTTPDQDGKLRYPDIANQLALNPDPLCFFDASGKVDAFIRAYVKSLFGKASYPIASDTPYEQQDLFTFCHTKVGDKPSLLASITADGTLRLKTDGTGQQVDMTQVAPGSVRISSHGVIETYPGVARVFADLKGGNDRLDLHQGNGVTASLPATMCGGAGDDRVSADTGPVQLYGDGGPTACTVVPAESAGADTLQGGAGTDKLAGGPGGDALDGGAGADVVTGEDGDDVLRGGAGNDTINGGAGDDTTDYGDHANAVVLTLPGSGGSANEHDANTGVENAYGGTGADRITLRDVGTYRIDGGAGNDTISAGPAAGLLSGGEGNDRFAGGTGAVQILGGPGNDTVVDGPGSQVFNGEDGTDTADYSRAAKRVTVTLDGDANDGPDGARTDNVADADVVIGSAFDDHLTGGSGADQLRGGAGADHLEGGPNADTLSGATGNDVLDGNSGDDIVHGEAGDDTLHGGPGADDLSGGADSDVADYGDRTDNLVITKNNVANDGGSTDNWKDNVRTDVETIVGGSGSDRISGYAGADTLRGGVGNDRLEGLKGADVLDGGTGDDLLYDLTENDTTNVTGDSTADTFLGGDGLDYAYGAGGTDTFTMGAGDDRVYAGSGTDTISGGDGNDQLHGGPGDDTIAGEAGDDNMWGDDGNDVLKGGASLNGTATIVGGNGSDTIYNATGGGSIYAGVSGTATGTETDTSANTIYGYGGTNTYVGGAGPDSFHLGAGNDTVKAYLGDDVISLGDGTNRAYGDAGNDTITGGSGIDTVQGDDGNDVLRGGAGSDQLIGNAGNDRLLGEADDDALDGGDGDDVLDGGTQADSIVGGPGADTVTYANRVEPIAVKEDGNNTDGGTSDASSNPSHVGLRDYVRYDIETIIGGSGSDSLSIGSTFRTGSATLIGGPGNDALTERSSVPTTFIGGPGNDTLTGGSGRDLFQAGAVPDGADEMSGGADIDIADYFARPAGTVIVTLDNLANDGAHGERDNVRTDIESARMPGASTGTSRPVN